MCEKIASTDQDWDHQESASCSSSSPVVSSLSTPSSSSNTEYNELERQKEQVKDVYRKCAFTNAEIIEFEPTYWTTSVPRNGIPLGLSSRLRKRLLRRIDSFEMEREGLGKKRIVREKFMSEGYLNHHERKEILQRCGLERTQSFDIAEIECNSIQKSREESNILSDIEETMEHVFPNYPHDSDDLRYFLGLHESSSFYDPTIGISDLF